MKLRGRCRGRSRGSQRVPADRRLKSRTFFKISGELLCPKTDKSSSPSLSLFHFFKKQTNKNAVPSQSACATWPRAAAPSPELKRLLTIPFFKRTELDLQYEWGGWQIAFALSSDLEYCHVRYLNTCLMRAWCVSKSIRL